MEWKEVLLSEFLEFNPKRTIKKNEVARKITMDLLIPHSKQIYNFKYEPYTGGAKFSNGDTIMARITPCLENGKHAYVSCLNEGEIAYGSTEYIVLCGKNGVSDNEFVYYLSHTPQFVNTAIKSMVGSSGRQRAQVPVLENLIMPVPVNLSDQRKIAGILSALDAKIENNNKINANLEAQAQALFKSWFVDFTPFKDQPFVDSELGPIPQGWKVGKINEFVDVIYGAPYKSKLFNTQKEGLPLIRIRDLKTCSPQFYTKELLPNTELVNYGDVVAGMDAEFTPHIWLGETGLLNQRVCKFKPHTGISPLYSMLMIKPKLEFAQNYKVGTTVSHLGKSDIDKFIIIVPPLDIVKEVSSIFDAVLNEQINLAKENQRLAALRDTLLPKLMSGEIKL